MLFNKEKKEGLPLKGNIFSSAITCYLFPFIVFGGHLLYCILCKLIPSAGNYYLIHYLYTYDHGYISRGLVGEVISWFTDTVTDDITRLVVTIFSALLMLAMSLCIGKALSKVRLDKDRLMWILFIVVLVFMIPMPYKYYYLDIKLDKLVWALALFGVYLADTKLGKWVAPFICAIATMVNPIFVFTSMILLAIILLQEAYSSGKRTSFILPCVTYVIIIALALLAPISEKWVGFANAGEMVEYYFARYDGQISESTYNLFVNMWLIDFFEPLEKLAEASIETYFKGFGMGNKFIFNFVILALPAYTLLGIFWKKVIKEEKAKFQKFIYFLCAISPIVIIPPLVLSWEFSKLFYNNIFVQFGLIIYFIAKGNPAVVNICSRVACFAKKHFIGAVAVILYFMVIVAPIVV